MASEDWRAEDELPNDDDSDEGDLLEIAMQDCGMYPDGSCALLGTEYCDFECPFRDELFTDEDE